MAVFALKKASLWSNWPSSLFICASSECMNKLTGHIYGPVNLSNPGIFFDSVKPNCQLVRRIIIGEGEGGSDFENPNLPHPILRIRILRSYCGVNAMGCCYGTWFMYIPNEANSFAAPGSMDQNWRACLSVIFENISKICCFLRRRVAFGFYCIILSSFKSLISFRQVEVEGWRGEGYKNRVHKS